MVYGHVNVNGADLQQETRTRPGSELLCFCFRWFPEPRCSRGKRAVGTLTEVVVVFGLSGVADLLDIDVCGSGGDPHHRVVT